MTSSLSLVQQMEVVTLMAASLGPVACMLPAALNHLLTRALLAGVVDVATQSAVFNVFFALHCFSFGLAKATTCRVGYHLGSSDSAALACLRYCLMPPTGANHPTNAMRSARVSLLVSVVLGGLVGLALLAMRNVIGHLFSNDPAVWQDMSALMFVLSISYVGVRLPSVIALPGHPPADRLRQLLPAAF